VVTYNTASTHISNMTI